MFARILHLFLSLQGRINRTQFSVGFATWILLVYTYLMWAKNNQNTLFNFFVSLIFVYISIHIMFCVFGKRLHDFGRSAWPITGVLTLMLFAWIMLMLNFGGMEYLDSLHQNPEIVEDPEAMRSLTENYHSTQQVNLHKAYKIIAAIPVLFTLWVSLTPGATGENKYGDIPSSIKA